jgi:hypothetical protein
MNEWAFEFNLGDCAPVPIRMMKSKKFVLQWNDVIARLNIGSRDIPNKGENANGRYGE